MRGVVDRADSRTPAATYRSNLDSHELQRPTCFDPLDVRIGSVGTGPGSDVTEKIPSVVYLFLGDAAVVGPFGF